MKIKKWLSVFLVVMLLFTQTATYAREINIGQTGNFPGQIFPSGDIVVIQPPQQEKTEEEPEEEPKGHAHEWSDWEIIAPADGTEMGRRRRECVTCGVEMIERFYSDDTLYRGIEDREDDVTKLQEALIEKDYLDGEPDGKFGPNTQAAIRKFQGDQGFYPDGIAWEPVLEKLYDGLGDGGEEAVVSVVMELEGTRPGTLSTGQTAREYYRVTNVGEATLRVTAFGVERDGQMCDYAKLIDKPSNSQIRPGESFRVEHDILVYEEDIAAGKVKRNVGVFGVVLYSADTERPWVDGDEGKTYFDGHWEVSETYEIPVVEKEIVHEVNFATRVASVPQVSTEFFVPGEQIFYDYVIENLSETALINVNVVSSLTGSVAVIPRIEAGATYVGEAYAYKATFDDAVGPLVNQTEVTFIYEDTQTSDAVAAAPAEVWIGFYDGGIGISKAVANMPRNGSYFEVGETVDFTVTIVNETNQPMYNVVLTDTLVGGNGSVETVLLEVPEMEVGASETVSYAYVVTEADAAKGFITNSAIVRGIDRIELYYESGSEDVVVPTGAFREVRMETHETSMPQVSTEFYVPGETIYYECVIENLSSTALLNVAVYSSLSGDVMTIPRIEAGETFTGAPHSYAPTFDETPCVLVNSTHTTFTYENTQESGTAAAAPVEVRVGFYDGGIGISKTVANAPRNGSHFEVGETVDFAVAITNETNQPMYNVVLTDMLTSGSGSKDTILLELPSMEVNETQTARYSYVITEVDAAQGYITNCALVHGVDRIGLHYESITEDVWVGVHDGTLAITKSVVSTPANGSFYTEGEEIEYEITSTNNTNQAIFDIVVTDCMSNGSGYTETKLSEGVSWAKDVCATTGFSYTVTAADVAAGFVTNFARIHAFDGAGLEYETESNAVIVRTSAEPAPAAAATSAPAEMQSDAEVEKKDAKADPLYLMITGTNVEGVVERSDHHTSAALYQAQNAGEAKMGMQLSAASEEANGNQIIYIADSEGKGYMNTVQSFLSLDVDLMDKQVMFGSRSAMEAYSIASLLRMRVSDEAMNLTNLTNLTNEMVFKVYKTALSMSSVRSENVQIAYGDDLLTLVVWDQEHNGQCFVIVTRKN